MRGPLEALYRDFDYAGRLAHDAIRFPRRYPDPRDREIVALLAASLAYGRVELFSPWVEQLLVWLGPSPRRFVERFEPARDIPGLAPFHYRFTRGRDLAAALLAIQRLIARHGSLRAAFLSGYRPEAPDVREALERFAGALLEQDFRPVGLRAPSRGLRHLFPRPSAGGACKRWNLFLRWMVRRDRFDFGDWPEVSPAQLIVPLDTHVAHMARALGLTRLRTRNWRMAEDVTRSLRALDPEDPVKYDFALCHTRMRGDCRGRRDLAVCPGCRLRPLCRHWAGTRTPPAGPRGPGLALVRSDAEG